MSTTESAVGELTEYVLIESKSPGRLAWERFRRDRVAVTASFVVLFFVGIALFAPLVCKAHRHCSCSRTESKGHCCR
jgi:ABC-type antimicrobial peptide transport system permease subunit